MKFNWQMLSGVLPVLASLAVPALAQEDSAPVAAAPSVDEIVAKTRGE